ncbi:aldehyde dehydrogenase family protein [Parahaliea mediterranea]|uniref:aldehyde dehydrogenase family protein n=1 Tax=Parahaliea mediterranea TaxID=651086 RepID=UPI0019D43E93|nr:aldehyde dehydrogenase family protein [Parahaliea mediterranea]
MIAAAEHYLPVGRTLLLGGQWQAGERCMPVYNPWTRDVLQEVACAGPAEVARALEYARSGARRSRALGSGERAVLLRRAAELVQARAAEFARCITSESGKPISAAQKEVARCIHTLRLSAEEATRIVGETLNFDSVEGGAGRSGYYQYEPLGIVVAITPFNDPLNLVAHKLGPAIAAGNATILKPAEQAPLSALMLVRVLLEAGLPPGVVNVLTGYGSDFGAALVGAPEVALVSFTGGEAAGQAIARQAGMKRLLMELGANSPVIVSDRADLDRAVPSCVSGAYWASGQNCVGVQRIFVQQRIYREFAERFACQARALQVGDPGSEHCDVGPLISPADVQRVDRWVQQALSQGANLLCGGEAVGAVAYLPTVLDVGQRQVSVCDTEVFGPVVSLHSYDALDEAIAAANRPDYMIHGAIFTDSLQEAMRAIRELECAGVLVNDSTDYRLDAMPFGGSKRGSMGREGVRHAIAQMVQTKTVCFNLSA